MKYDAYVWEMLMMMMFMDGLEFVQGDANIAENSDDVRKSF